MFIWIIPWRQDTLLVSVIWPSIHGYDETMEYLRKPLSSVEAATQFFSQKLLESCELETRKNPRAFDAVVIH